ncbi:hypothetical protein [Nocardia sp. BMG51109]|uniref:hypothetical protein n=1 Tax=Nocardia sp. BMG51109 TaxID=1056816 RepID=UPI0012EC4506|nr:hypothetical protein [Nocardia sp. BMG51109]
MATSFGWKSLAGNRCGAVDPGRERAGMAVVVCPGAAAVPRIVRSVARRVGLVPHSEAMARPAS